MIIRYPFQWANHRIKVKKLKTYTYVAKIPLSLTSELGSCSDSDASINKYNIGN